MRKLYSLISDISANNSDNPLLEENYADLSEMFVGYFMNKIIMLRDDVASCTKYQPQNPVQFTVRKFKHVNEEDVRRIITAMQIKQCELDAVPTSIIKGILDEILSMITNIVNISLIMGQFSLNWKTAKVKPLLKKSGLDLIAKNYRPFSNLLFMSKVIKKWH